MTVAFLSRPYLPWVALWLLPLTACGQKLIQSDPGASTGESCVDRHCAGDLVCDHEGFCADAAAVGTTAEGEDCSDSIECAYGLVCDAQNVCVVPGSPGTGEDGDTCTDDSDCQAGSACDAGVCTDLGIPWWDGGDCPPDEDDAAYFYAYFDVPDLPVSGPVDFYALPFPNDIRIGTDGHLDLSGFPDPGAAAPEVESLLLAVQAESTGFGRNPTVYFRFNRKQDTSSLSALTDGATIQWVSLDEDAPGSVGAMSFRTATSRGRYVCQDWLAVSTYDGVPLAPGHTYAVWLTRGVTDQSGAPLTRDDGFKVMMQAERPADLTMGRAWDAYGPLRDYVDREGIDGDDITVAAVFTVADPSGRVRTFPELAQAAAPALHDAVVCDTGVSSPCDDGGERVCGARVAGYTEIHGRLDVPGYRAGDGDVHYDAGGARPQGVTTEAACAALTIPDGTMPTAGWPVVIYQPDAGGTFRAAIDDGLAGALAARGVATFTIELPAHGERGEGAAGGRASFLDGAHPLALRGNLLQAAADPSAAEAWLDQVDLDATSSPTGAALRFDAEGRWFVGRGAGAASGVAYVAWADAIRGAVFGNGWGHFATLVSGDNAPSELHRGLQVAFADSAVSPWHPLVSLLQLHAEGLDAVDEAEALVREPHREARHLLFVDGVGDQSVPRGALDAVLTAADVPTAGAVLFDYGQSTTTLPVTENVGTDDGRRTAASVQYPDGPEALFTAALPQVVEFVASPAGSAPTISP